MNAPRLLEIAPVTSTEYPYSFKSYFNHWESRENQFATIKGLNKNSVFHWPELIYIPRIK